MGFRFLRSLTKSEDGIFFTHPLFFNVFKVVNVNLSSNQRAQYRIFDPLMKVDHKSLYQRRFDCTI